MNDLVKEPFSFVTKALIFFQKIFGSAELVLLYLHRFRKKGKLEGTFQT
jgi:hypothetical protein